MRFTVPDSANLTERKPNDKDSKFTYKAQRCHGHVEGKVSNPYAVCNASMGSKAYRKKKG